MLIKLDLTEFSAKRIRRFRINKQQQFYIFDVEQHGSTIGRK